MSTNHPPAQKPADEHSDEEIRAAPAFKAMRDVMPAVVSDEQLILLAREAIQLQWLSARDSRRAELVSDFVEQLRVCYPSAEKASQIIITRGDQELGLQLKQARSPRWLGETYAKHLGEYSKQYRSEKHPDASGEFKLRIAPGRNDDEKVFMELTEPGGKVLAFPPADPQNPVNTDHLKEVSSISRLLRDSSHRTTLSVWQYFGLSKTAQSEV